jgi:NADPH:quinone reductase-like Zn-dependent oxidoreductase
MKAIVQRVYGSADVLEFVDIDKPIVGDNDVLVRVAAAGLHVGDWHVMTGRPYMLRVIGFGLLVPKVRVRGIDVAGTVAAVGRNVVELRPGDEVFGTCEGSFAEYALAPAGNLAHKPFNLTFEEAAAVPTSGFAALQALRDRGEIELGQKVLVVGATGGVGAFAVQLALGILVMVGGEGGGKVLGGAAKWIRGLLLSPFIGQRLRPLATAPNQKDLLVLKELVESGRLTPAIGRTFPLSATADAFRYLEKGEGPGKVVIRVGFAPARSRS